MITFLVAILIAMSQKNTFMMLAVITAMVLDVLLIFTINEKEEEEGDE